MDVAEAEVTQGHLEVLEAQPADRYERAYN